MYLEKGIYEGFLSSNDHEQKKPTPRPVRPTGTVVDSMVQLQLKYSVHPLLQINLTFL